MLLLFFPRLIFHTGQQRGKQQDATLVHVGQFAQEHVQRRTSSFHGWEGFSVELQRTLRSPSPSVGVGVGVEGGT